MQKKEQIDPRIDRSSMDFTNFVKAQRIEWFGGQTKSTLKQRSSGNSQGIDLEEDFQRSDG